jgi:hypothetical protein
MKAKRLFFVTFLSASICAFVCYTASAKFTNEMPSIQTTSSVDGHEINNVNIQPDGTQMLYGSELGSTKADVKNASTDSINLSCVFVYDKNEKIGGKQVITPGSIYVYNADQKFSKAYSTAVKNDTMKFRIPKGVYDVYSYFTMGVIAGRAKYNGCSQAVVVREGFNLQSDTIIKMDMALAKNYVHINKLKPNGDTCKWGTATYTSSTAYTFSEDRNIKSQSYWVFYFRNDIDKYIVARTISNAGGKTIKTDGTVEDLTNMMDILISDVSDKYQIYTLYDAYDNSTDANAGHYLIGISQNGVTKSDTIANNPKSYVHHDDYFAPTPEGLQSQYHAAGMKFTTLNNGFPLLGVRSYSIAQIGANDPVRLYLDVPANSDKNKFGLILNGIYGDYVTFKLNTAKTDSSATIHYNSGPRYVFTDGNKVKYINNGLDGTTFQYSPTLGFNDLSSHPAFTYPEQGKIINCNNAPACVNMAENYYSSTYGSKYFSLRPYYVGRYGEVRNVDYDSLKMEIKYNDSIIANDYSKLTSSLTAWAKTKHPDGKIKATFTNPNIIVDSIAGMNYSEIAFDETKNDWTPPTLQMLQFRNVNDSTITDHFDKQTDGVMELAAGDFSYVDDDSHFDCGPVTAKVWFTPNNTDNWTEMPINEDPALYRAIGFGSFYRGQLSNVTTPSSNFWYDLKIELTDTAGNSQMQIISPAFRIKEATGIGAVKASQSSCRAYVNGNNLYITNGTGATAKIFTIAGQCIGSYDASTPISIANLTRGIYLVETSKSGIRTVSKILKY